MTQYGSCITTPDGLEYTTADQRRYMYKQTVEEMIHVIEEHQIDPAKIEETKIWFQDINTGSPFAGIGPYIHAACFWKATVKEEDENGKD